MVKPLRYVGGDLYHFDANGEYVGGLPPAAHGAGAWLWGDSTRLSGDVSGLWGNITNLSGNATGMSGDASGIEGNLDSIPSEDRAALPNLTYWVAV